MTIVIALGDLLLQSSRELTELYEGRSVTLRLTPENSSSTSEGPSTGGPYQDAIDPGRPASSGGGQSAKRPDEKDAIDEAKGTLAERTQIRYWSRFSSGSGDIVEVRQAKTSGQFRGYPLTNVADMIDGVTIQGVDPSYEVIFRTRMLAGRWISPADADQRLTPVVISETLWKQLGRAPIDQVPIVLHTSDGTAMRVVGVTKAMSSFDMPTVFAHYDAARVFFAVFMESVVATFVAGVIGVGIAVVVVRFLPLEALSISLSDTPAFPAGAAIAGVVISTSIGALCGIIPALAAVRIKPIDAIRY